MMERNIDDSLIELNDIFDEMIDDAQEFAKDITFSVDLLPLASIGCLFLGIIVFGYEFYFRSSSTGFWFLYDKGLGIFSIVVFSAISIEIYRRYRKLKKKYSRFFELVEELKLKKR